ncbi:hypothetical protein EVAR_6407_1 [Eumeta japonica]|uniref:Uncharacterized protein n=1 Tax=Eumeta variegata TaxID=151549 RepID=A0A4C1TDP0_EUMVA|nr:hypothetical protein EVAR_6407_1 [Eumeta japonica]
MEIARSSVFGRLSSAVRLRSSAFASESRKRQIGRPSPPAVAAGRVGRRPEPTARLLLPLADAPRRSAGRCAFSIAVVRGLASARR